MKTWNRMTDRTPPRDGSEFLIRYPKQDNVMSLVSWDRVHASWKSKGETIYPEEQQCEWAEVPR